MRGWLSVAVVLAWLGAYPRDADAQWVSNNTWVEPNPFSQGDQITVHVEGDFDSSTWDWPCDTNEMDSYCAPFDHAAYVWGSDGFNDNDTEYDWGQSSGSESWDFWDVYGTATMQSIGYSTEVVVEYCDQWFDGCWEVSADGSAEADPQGLQVTSDKGDTVWWFNGEDPDPTNFPTAITLTSTGGDQTTWSVDTNSEFGIAVQFSSSQGASTIVTASDVGSGSTGDMRIVASVGSQHAYLWMTARLPKNFERATGADVVACPWEPQQSIVGWYNEVHYIARDQLGSAISSAPYNEFWNNTGAPDNVPTDDYQSFAAPFSATFNWGFQSPQSATTTSSGAAWDTIDVAGSSLTVPTVNPPSCETDTSIDNWTQQWFVGSATSGQGVRVQTNTLHRYLGMAIHENVR